MLDPSLSLFCWLAAHMSSLAIDSRLVAAAGVGAGAAVLFSFMGRVVDINKKLQDISVRVKELERKDREHEIQILHTWSQMSGVISAMSAQVDTVGQRLEELSRLSADMILRMDGSEAKETSDTDGTDGGEFALVN